MVCRDIEQIDIVFLLGDVLNAAEYKQVALVVTQRSVPTRLNKTDNYLGRQIILAFMLGPLLLFELELPQIVESSNPVSAPEQPHQTVLTNQSEA